MDIRPGDWVRITPIFPGIWKVYRVVAGFKEDEWSLKEPLRTSKRVLIFCHRLVNDSWKRSFSHNMCELSLIRKISKEERKRANELLLSDSKLRKAFEQYQEKNNRLDLIANIGFGGLMQKEAADFPNLCEQIFADQIGQGMTVREVLGLLQERGLLENMGKIPQQVTLQLSSVNHELRDGEFVCRKFRTLPF